ncbi:MAG: metal ABC transporter substrate-binding protein [Verrucomicrobiota bacterium]|nr:metal ABC transporter substrate-binding protein [Verrucomicrobiota bacterium]
MKKILFFTFSLIFSLAFLSAEPVKVVTLSSVLSDFVKNVGGDRVKVIDMVKPGQDPHEFNPTVIQMREMSAAPLIFASGKGMENYLGKLEDTSKGKTQIINIGAGIPSQWIEQGQEKCEGHDHAGTVKDGKSEDPHWWHSIPNAIKATEIIRDALISADPSQKEIFTKNAKDYIARLKDLQKWVDGQIAQIPRDKRILITSHDALGYFAKDYGFKIHSIEGVSTKDTATSKHIAELIAEIKKEGVKAIFAENISNPRVQKQIEKETGAVLAGTLYADGLGTGAESTYIGMYKHNVSTIVDALK